MNGAENLAPEVEFNASRTAETNRRIEVEILPRRRVIGLVGEYSIKGSAMALAGLTAFANYLYWDDVRQVDEIAKQAHSYIIENSPVPENPATYLPEDTSTDPLAALRLPATFNPTDRVASISFGGFGLTEIDNSAQVYKPLDTIGANLSMHYNNRVLDTTELADTVNDYVVSHRINKLVFNGNSTGAAIATDVAVKVTEQNPKVGIAVMGLDAPAINEYVLRKQSRDDGYTMLEGVKFPGADRSRYARVVAEMWLRRSEFLKNPFSFFGTLNQVKQSVFDDDDLAQNTLLIDQFEEIQEADQNMDTNLKKLSELPTWRRPKIELLRAADPADDDVVNTIKAYADLHEMCAKDHLELGQPIPVGGDYIHGFPGKMVKSYHVAIDKYLLPQVIDSLRAQDAAAPKNLVYAEAAPLSTKQPGD